MRPLSCVPRRLFPKPLALHNPNPIMQVIEIVSSKRIFGVRDEECGRYPRIEFADRMLMIVQAATRPHAWTGLLDGSSTPSEHRRAAPAR